MKRSFFAGDSVGFRQATEACSPEAWNHDDFRKIIPFYGPRLQVSEIWSGWWLGTFRDNPSHCDFHIFQDGLNHQPVIIYPEHCLTHPHLQPWPGCRAVGAGASRSGGRVGGLGRGPSVRGDFLWSPFGKLTKRTGKSPSFSSVHQLFLWVICSYVSLL